MIKLNDWHWRICAALVIALIAIYLSSVFPAQSDYRDAADEGTYYGYGRELVEHGIGGFSAIVEGFLATPAGQHPPSPLRIGTIALAALALSVNDSFRALSCLSLLSFVFVLIGVTRCLRATVGREIALITLVLLATSPLQLAMGRRALMDELAIAASVWSIGCFLRLIQSQSPRALIAFVGCFTSAILIKETALLLLPFFAANALYAWLKNRSFTDAWNLLLALASPPLLALGTYVAVYGVDAVRAIFVILPDRSNYDAIWEQGPWYRYLIDYLLLSPSALLLALGYAGFVLLSGRDREFRFWIALAVYLLIVYAPLTKNVRYCLLLDVPIRILAAGMLVLLARVVSARLRELHSSKSRIWPVFRSSAHWLVPVALLGLAANDVAAFQRYFVSAGIYDPVSYNLLFAQHIVPPLSGDAPAAADKALVAAQKLVATAPSADNFLELGRAYCAAELHWECAWASREALRLSGDNALAFNNLCVAYNGLRAWQEAMSACREALRIKPDFQLARNNLVWAQQQAQTNK
jgi:4-amino-4-deoxy-L-arabinose transferase-like glycosyltransferase